MRRLVGVLFVVSGCCWAQGSAITLSFPFTCSGNTCSTTYNVAIGTPVPGVTLSPTAGVLVPVTISTSGPVVVSATGFYLNNAAGALTWNLPAITVANIGAQFCFRSLPAKTGALTLQAPASTYIGVTGTNGSAAGTLVSSGTLGDAACVVAVTTTQYLAYIGTGVWTNN